MTHTAHPDRRAAAHRLSRAFRSPLAGLAGDLARYRWPVAVMRVLRRGRLFLPGRGEMRRALVALPALADHAAHLDEADALFFLSYRHYLARGMGADDRIRAAHAHYAQQSAAFDPAYRRAVAGGGLSLWGREAGGVAYGIRLSASRDAPWEGGLSLDFEVDGGPVCTMSFSLLPEDMLWSGGAPGRLAPLVVRKQSAQDHRYQAAFNRAFDRTTAAHLCFGALSGFALAQGMTRAVGISARRQPSVTPEAEARFRSSYDVFWETLGGQAGSPFGLVIPLPAFRRPLGGVTGAKRRRALQRRTHVEAVFESARARIAGHLPADPPQ
ncbi:DUF535 family protein [Oceaniglobus roseus]|uniref:DUF535 family protein n=1 Tax=Oceaniglobus roseus TaxID=1737570 RepID=UPI000C7F4CC3|nr:DUF535 family protein [Kandeliimicrobium roseum]